MRSFSCRKVSISVVSTGLMACLAFAGAQQPEPAPGPADDDEGVEVQARGPVHEAFAAPVVFDPKAGFVVPKAPPAVIEEVPPDQKPQGQNVQWVSGYWAWDDDRDDFLWVSGFWRDLPPGRQWVPGYWSATQGGWQWTSGYWAPAEGGSVQYLPQPPASVDNGPNVPQPSAESTWVPGLWTWQQERYYWRPGYWIVPPPQWVWVPSYYAWTPCGYVFVQGYWDYPIVERGLLFAPAYISPVVIARPRFVFVPTVTLVAAALTQAFFCRPTYGHYYFGDYFAPTYVGAGFVPWGNVTNVNVTNINVTNINVNRGPRFYDPIYVHERTVQRARDPRWEQRLRANYRDQVERAEARPARTFAAAQKAATKGSAGGRPAQVQTLAAVARDPAAAARLEKVDAGRRDEVVRQAAEAKALRERRAKVETEARAPAGSTKAQAGPTPLRDRPKLELPKSAIATATARSAEKAKGGVEKVKRAAPSPEPPRPEMSKAIGDGPLNKGMDRAKGALEKPKRAGPTESAKSPLVGPRNKGDEPAKGAGEVLKRTMPGNDPPKGDQPRSPFSGPQNKASEKARGAVEKANRPGPNIGTMPGSGAGGPAPINRPPGQSEGLKRQGTNPQPELRRGMDGGPATKGVPRSSGPPAGGMPLRREGPPSMPPPRTETRQQPFQGQLRAEPRPATPPPRMESRPPPPPPRSESKPEARKKGNRD